MTRGVCAWVGLPIGTTIQVTFSSCSVNGDLCTSRRHRKPRLSHFSVRRAQNERLCVFVRGSRGSASKFLKSMDQNVRHARSAFAAAPRGSSVRQGGQGK